MQGTWQVRSLIRLFGAAVLLCLGWLVLTSTQASAAERPAPARPLVGLEAAVPLVDGSGLDSLVGGLLTPAPADRPTHPPSGSASGSSTSSQHTTKAGREKRSHTTRSAIRPILVKPVEEVVGTVRSTVDSGLTFVGGVADATESVPVVGAPVVDITDAVGSLVRSLPVLGEPSPIGPLPIGDGIVPVDRIDPAAPVTEPVAGEPDHRIPDRVEATSDGGEGPREAPATTPDQGAARARAVSSAGPGAPSLPAGPVAPLDAVPAPPTQPSPGGAGPGALDPVTTSEHLSLADLSSSLRTHADWRLPCGPCAQPGTRPD